MNAAPEEFLANDEGLLTHVVVGGERIEADVAVLGIGVEPATRFLVRILYSSTKDIDIKTYSPFKPRLIQTLIWTPEETLS